MAPFASPRETYEYYSLPLCKPTAGNEYMQSLGEALEGDRLVATPYQLRFRTDVENAVLCNKTFQLNDLKNLREAVKQDYFVQMFYDNLPVWCFIGMSVKTWQQDTVLRAYLLSTHIHYDISYNGNWVIGINATPKRMIDITATNSLNVQFSYSVKWQPSSVVFGRRMDRYVRDAFLPEHMDTRLFGLVKSCAIMFLLAGSLATVRVLKRTMTTTETIRDDAMVPEQAEVDSKYQHGDPFRPPSLPNLFSAMLGVGAQVLAMAVCVLTLGLVGAFYPHNRGALLAASVMLYTLTMGIASYVSGVHYKAFGGTKPVSNMVLSSALFCGPLLAVFSFLNTVAAYYGSTVTLSFDTIAVVAIIWAMVAVPLFMLGRLAAKKSSVECAAPCRLARVPPDSAPRLLPWLLTTASQMVLAAFLPLSTIRTELPYIFASVWGYKVYVIYPILCVVFVTLVVVTAGVTVALTYLQLAAQDHSWRWRSLLCGGSTGIFVYGYCCYYYFKHSDLMDISGFMQACFYFGYNAFLCYTLFLMLGYVGFHAALLFVRSARIVPLRVIGTQPYVLLSYAVVVGISVWVWPVPPAWFGAWRALLS